MDALVLSGGGSKGSWEAGVIKYLGETRDSGYGFISGTSVGALNALGLAQFSADDFAAASLYLEEMWRTHICKRSDVLSLRFPPVVAGFWNPSVGKNNPLRELIHKVVDINMVRKSGIKLRMPAVDLLTGEVTEYDESFEDLISACLSSAAYPLAFPPIRNGERYETDGGIRDTAPLGAAVRAGADKVTVVLVGDPDRMNRVEEGDMWNCLQVGLRVLDIMHFDVLQNDIKVCGMYNQLVDAGLAPGKRRIDVEVLYPSEPLASTFTFNSDVLGAQIEQGYEDARRIMESGDPV